MKNIYFTTLAFLLLCVSTIYAQPASNSNRFIVKDYIALNNSGKYYPYNAHGYYENAASGAIARIYILPNLSLDLDNIKFVDDRGYEVSSSTNNIQTMIIPITVNSDLPNESQKAAIVAAVKENATIRSYAPDMVRNPTTKMPAVHPMLGAGTPIYNQIMAIATNYQNDV
ncbi:MAG: hypothetical protein RSC97_11255, partial [Eubacterium sp.]